jgi:hypothetical protein
MIIYIENPICSRLPLSTPEGFFAEAITID